jgi:hypothetical protein
MKIRALLVLLGIAVLIPAHTPAQEVVRSPCADSLYQVLRGKPLNELTEREYEYFKQRETACTDYQRLAALVAQRQIGTTSTAARRVSSESRTQANAQGGVDIFVRNTADEPIIVNSIRVYECLNLRVGSCGMHHPKLVIQPGREMRVLTIRFASRDRQSNYRYRYHTALAEP